MEEIKQENVEKVEVVEPKKEYDFAKLDSTLDKLVKENEILKKEILSMKNQVSVNPEPVVEKAHEINYKIWKEKF